MGSSWVPDTQRLRHLESLKVSLWHASEMTSGWEPLDNFRMEAGHQREQGMIRGLKLLAQCLQPLGGVRSKRLSSIINGQ